MKKYVDFHMHSIGSRAIGDVVEWHSIEDSLRRLASQNVKYFAFTDHDYFKLTFYFSVIDAINKLDLDLVVFPGVEITMLRENGVKGHVLFLFEKNISEDKLYKLQNIINENKQDSGLNLKKFIDKLNDFEFYLIPHVGKSEYICFEDIDFYIDKIQHVESKPSKREYFTFCKKANKQIPCLMFSDCHDWQTYKRPETYVEDRNFHALKEILKEIKTNNE